MELKEKKNNREINVRIYFLIAAEMKWMPIPNILFSVLWSAKDRNRGACDFWLLFKPLTVRCFQKHQEEKIEKKKFSEIEKQALIMR